MEHETNPAPSASIPSRSLGQRWPMVAGSVLMLAAGLVGGFFVLRESAPLCSASTLAVDPGDDKLPVLMRAWKEPDLALIISGQMHGYIKECGCSNPQLGGLHRRYNFMELLRQKGWPVAGIDLGELPGTHIPKDQKLLKYGVSMHALDLMGYRAVGTGKYELETPFADALVNLYAPLKKLVPVASSMADAQEETGFLHTLGARPYAIFAENKLKVGVVSLVGVDLAEKFPQEKFLKNTKVLTEALSTFATQNADMAVILYHDDPLDAGKKLLQGPQADKARQDTATKLAAFSANLRAQNGRVPPVSLIVSLTEDSEPPGQMTPLAGTPTQLVEIGHKGRYVGVLGVYRAQPQLKLQYQLVPIGEDFDNAPGKEKENPVSELFESYAQRVKQRDLLSHFKDRMPHATQLAQASSYVGSERCGDCHQHAFQVWENRDPKNNFKHGHSNAFETLSNAKHPSHRQYDGECVVCHTVGFKHPTGYYDSAAIGNLKQLGAPKFAQKFTKHNKKLENVGCESCHGPSSAHADNPQNVALYPLINPFRATDAERVAQEQAKNGATPEVRQTASARHAQLQKGRMLRLDFFCQKCHDTDNDVHWNNRPFIQRWQQIAHPTPRENGGGNQAAQNAPAVPNTPRQSSPNP